MAYAGQKLFGPAVTDSPTYEVVMFFDEEFERNKSKPLPEKDVTIRLAHAADGRLVKFVRNSNYFGEWKKGVFAGENYRAKLKGDAIFLHAGCRKDTLENRHGVYVTSYSLFVALSANGKTSTTCKVLARKGHERSWLIQDDGGTLYRDGRFRGFEAGGLFIKTDCLNPGEQREAYYACLRKDTFLENVSVSEDGSIDFYDLARTSNGRAVVERRDFMHAANDINAKRIDNLFLITRGNIIPAVAKLTHEQAAAFMVLGQSMESSAGDPTLAGTIKNEFFYDPFIAGDRSEHANLFYEILQHNPQINCYLLNTGWVGEGDSYKDIALADTMGILDSLLRGGARRLGILAGHRAGDPPLDPGRRFDSHAAGETLRRRRFRVPPAEPRSPAGGVHGQLPRPGSGDQGRLSGAGRCPSRMTAPAARITRWDATRHHRTLPQFVDNWCRDPLRAETGQNDLFVSGAYPGRDA